MTSRTLEKNSEMAFLLFLAMSDRKVSFYDDVSVKKTIFARVQYVRVMKSYRKVLIKDVEREIGKKIDLHSDVSKLLSIVGKHHLHLNSLSPKAKDRLALFAGFQSWNDFRDALHGDDDGRMNYESKDE